MSTIEIVIGAAVTVIVAILGAFGLGHSRGTGKAEAKAEKQRTEEKAAVVEAVAERRVEVTKEAADVQQTVSRMLDDDVDRELHEKWQRPGSR